MLTRGRLNHAYGFGGYYAAPYHVTFLADAYPVEGRTEMAISRPVMLYPAVLRSGSADLRRGYVGMDPADPGTWTRPYVPTEGMFARLHQDQAKARGQEPQRRKGAGKRG
jgi:hypothetical protein